VNLCRAVHDGADRGAIQTDDQIAFPVTWDRSIVGFVGAFADHHLRGHVSPRFALCPGSRNPQRSPGPQTQDQLALQRPSALDVERLVNRFVADPHRVIIGELDPKPPRDLLRTPPSHPTAITPMRLVPTDPCRTGRTNDLAVCAADDTRQAVLDVVAQPRVFDELGGLGSLRDEVRLPLRY